MSTLTSWRDGPAKEAILAFVAAATGADGSEPVPVEERVAVFDNDGTLWCEKPVPIQMDFVLRRFVEMAEADPALRERQPFKAAVERDHGWFETVLREHYAGDDHNVKTVLGGLLAAYAAVVELLALLAANGFANYVVSGGGRDFVRPVSQELYGVPRERVIGSAS